MKDRLLEGVELAGYKKHGRVSKLASLTGYSVGQVSDMLSGKVSLNDKFVRLVCNGVGLNIDWVTTGTPPMFIEPAQPVQEPLPPEMEELMVILGQDPLARLMLQEMMKMTDNEKLEYVVELREKNRGRR